MLIASQSLESTSTNANTADRYQVVEHVDSQVLAGEVDAKPSGEPDCYIEKQMDNLIEVCHFHHVQLHEGGYSVYRSKTGELQFYKPDGLLLSSTASPLHSDNSLQTSAKDTWYSNGDSMDYSVATYCIAASTKS